MGRKIWKKEDKEKEGKRDEEMGNVGQEREGKRANEERKDRREGRK